MTKFVLILYLCSLNAMQCDNGMITGIEFNSHYDCAIAGYEMSATSMKEMDKDHVEKHKLAVKFECKPIEIVLPQPKPQV